MLGQDVDAPFLSTGDGHVPPDTTYIESVSG